MTRHIEYQEMRCTNEKCTEYGDTYHAPMTQETEGALPPYGPPGGVHTYWICEDDWCPECGETGDEV